jgi:hypothetical protein
VGEAMPNFRHRIDFTLQLSPTQTANGHFAIQLNVNDDPATYVVSGALAAKTFSQSYDTAIDARNGLNQIFFPINAFLENLTLAIEMQDVQILDTKLFVLDFPNTGGNLAGSLQLLFDDDATDQAQINFILDGAGVTIKRPTIEEGHAVLAILGTLRQWLVQHSRLDLSTF